MTFKNVNNDRHGDYSCLLQYCMFRSYSLKSYLCLTADNYNAYYGNDVNGWCHVGF